MQSAPIMGSACASCYSSCNNQTYLGDFIVRLRLDGVDKVDEFSGLSRSACTLLRHDSSQQKTTDFLNKENRDIIPYDIPANSVSQSTFGIEGTDEILAFPRLYTS